MEEGKKRKPISNKLRFEVFKRDKFTCQYCGKRAPDVVLNIDHITPVAAGGKNELLNLATSCFECNSGKSDKKLSDDTAVSAQLDQLALIQERRNQLALIKKWLAETGKIQDEYVDAIDERIKSLLGMQLNERGRKDFSGYIRKFGFMEVIDAINIAAESYSNVETAISKVSGILHNREMEKKHPGYGKASIAFGVLRKRFDTSSRRYWPVMISCMELNVDLECVIRIAKSVNKEWEFFDSMNRYIKEYGSDSNA